MVDLSKHTKTIWHGRWIWADYVTARETRVNDSLTEYHEIPRSEQNVYVLFRQSLEIRAGLTKALINITADSRFKLFVNGHYVGRGINRCESQFWYYNQYDLTPFLQEGSNVLAIHARFYGRELAFYVPPEYPGFDKSTATKGGLLFDLQLAYSPEENSMDEWIGSGSSTKCIVNPAENILAPSKGGLGFVEEFDGRLLAKNWNELDFDDSEWQNATIYEYPIKTLLLDVNAPLFEEEVFPTEIRNVGEVDDGFFDLDPQEQTTLDFNILNALDSKLQPLSSATITNLDALLGKDGYCEINPPSPGKAISLLLYFDRDVVGYPRFMVDGPEGTIIDFIVSERIICDQVEQDYINTKRGSRVILRGGRPVFRAMGLGWLFGDSS